jgi:hypothetical protein
LKLRIHLPYGERSFAGLRRAAISIKTDWWARDFLVFQSAKGLLYSQIQQGGNHDQEEAFSVPGFDRGHAVQSEALHFKDH